MAKGIISVPEDKLDERIALLENLYGKYHNSTLVDNDLTDYFQFPTLKREVYIEEIQKEDGTRTTRVKEDFRGLQRSTLINLRTLSVFSTQLAVMQCTKLLVSRMHGGIPVA